MGSLTVVVGGQFGSEGKGAVCAAFAARNLERGQPQVAVRVGGPNAGHSAYAADGVRWALRQVPVAAVIDPDAALVIAAGSEVDVNVLAVEVEALELAGYKIRHRLLIDPQATMVDREHEQAESLNAHDRRYRTGSLVDRIGSTGKGIGAARSDRIWRQATLAGQHPQLRQYTDLVSDTGAWLRQALVNGADVVVEGVQGYGLGLHAGYYPYCTSIDCRAVDFLAMAGVSPWQAGVDWFQILVVVRPNPIRVAGNSGPLKDETTWEALGLKPEYTTVTQKVRRVGEGDPELVQAAIRANGGTAQVRLALTMLDHIDPVSAGVKEWAVLDSVGAGLVEQVERQTGVEVVYVGTGPTTHIWRDR
jgi:adenylosuccinate synthase